MPAIAVAIAIHNIPEGIAVSVPIYYATGSRKKAFGWSFLSGLAEPVGAGVGFLLLMPFFSHILRAALSPGRPGSWFLFRWMNCCPAAEEYGEHHLCIYGLVLGMIVMAMSLLLFM